MKPVFGIPFLWLATVATAQAPPKIPLGEGLSIVTAVHNPPRGDYESFKTINRIDARGIHVVFSGPTVKTPVRRIIQRRDQESSRYYLLRFAQNFPEVVPTSTALGASRLTLKELKEGKETAFKCCQLARYDNGPALAGTLTMVGTVPVTVIVNDEAVALPAVHARGSLSGQPSEFHFLDDPDNPIALKWQVGKQHLEVIRISFPAHQIAQALEKTGRADVYGIYFDVGSDSIRPESEPVLKEIAAAMEKNPAWKLSVEGHTDSIGTEPANLDLSKRRSAAVKEALVGRYQITAARLSTAGHGESKPKANNGTLEGRALNRRVELIRN